MTQHQTPENTAARPDGAMVEAPRPHGGALAAPDPAQVIAQATKEAKTLAPVIEDRKLYKTISGRKHVFVEGWTTLAIMRGCIPREVETVRQDDGSYVSISELVRLTDGAVLTRASAECGGPDESMWQNRAPYARRSMAQTRAAGKACRIAFSWVMVLAGYEGTPAEEMTEEGTRDGRKSKPATNGNGKKATQKQRERMVQLASHPAMAESAQWLRDNAVDPNLSQPRAGIAIGKAKTLVEEWDNKQAGEPVEDDGAGLGEPDEGPPPDDSDRDVGEEG